MSRSHVTTPEKRVRYIVNKNISFVNSSVNFDDADSNEHSSILKSSNLEQTVNDQ